MLFNGCFWVASNRPLNDDNMIYVYDVRVTAVSVAKEKDLTVKLNVFNFRSKFTMIWLFLSGRKMLITFGYPKFFVNIYRAKMDLNP